MPVVRIDGFVFWLVNLSVIISSASNVFAKTVALAAAVSVTRPTVQFINLSFFDGDFFDVLLYIHHPCGGVGDVMFVDFEGDVPL